MKQADPSSQASVRESIVSALAAETSALDVLLSGLTVDQWATPTSAVPWTIAHEVAHLAWTDRLATVAATEPDAFACERYRSLGDPVAFVNAGADQGATVDPQVLLRGWRTGAVQLRSLLGGWDRGALPWFGPPMSASSMLTARLMETWAHGVDIREATGREVVFTDGLRHVAHLGVKTRAYAFERRGLPRPEGDLRVDLTTPDRGVWSWGDEAALDRVTGPALDFCLLVTRRRHRDDLALRSVGHDADRWLEIAQAFAGDPGADPVRRSAS